MGELKNDNSSQGTYGPSRAEKITSWNKIEIDEESSLFCCFPITQTLPHKLYSLCYSLYCRTWAIWPVRVSHGLDFSGQIFLVQWPLVFISCQLTVRSGIGSDAYTWYASCSFCNILFHFLKKFPSSKKKNHYNRSFWVWPTTPCKKKKKKMWSVLQRKREGTLVLPGTYFLRKWHLPLKGHTGWWLAS